MGLHRLIFSILLLAFSSCASSRARSSYQSYPLRSASLAVGFAEVGPSIARLIAQSYQDKVAAPIRLTAGDGTGLELRELRVRAVVDGPLAFTELKMKFHNPRKRELEGRFEITLPPDASVARLAMRLGSRWQEAEVVAKSRGREVYEAFLHKQVDPVLLETAVGNRFRARVYPIPAEGDKEIIISYSELLPSSGEYRLLLAGLPEIKKLDVDVHHGNHRERSVSHDLVATKDLIVHTNKAQEVALRSGELIMMRWVPEAEDSEDVPQKLTILVDSSASSAGVYGQQVLAVESLTKALVRQYGAKLELEVACFDNRVTPIFKGRAASYGASQTESLLSHGAMGASNLEGALQWMAKRSGRLLLVGDGIATTGQRNAALLLSSRPTNLRPERVDVLAMSSAKDSETLESLVHAMGLAAGVLLSPDSSAATWAQQLGREAPAEIAVDVAGADWVWPKTLRATAAGQAVTAYAKFGTMGSERLESLRIQQSSAKGTRVVTLPVRDGEQALIQRQWAAEQLERLGRLQAEEPIQPRRELIENISHRFRILTAETSFLMLETEADYARFGIDRQESGDVLTVDATGLRRLKQGTNSARQEQWKELVASAEFKGRTPLREIQVTSSTIHEGSTAALRGIVRDKATGEPLTGVTIIITNKRTGANYSDISAADGRFAISSLAADSYQVLLVYGEVRILQTVDLKPGRSSSVEAKLDLSKLGTELIIVKGRPFIDTTRTSQSMTIDGSSLSNPPVPRRNFQSVLRAASGIHADSTGVSFSGSSSLEQHYLVDGLNTGGLSHAKVHSSAGATTKRMKRKPTARRYRKIQRLLAVGSFDRALATSLRWYTQSPASILAITLLGESLQALGHYRLATRAYASILDIYPSRAEMHRVAAAHLSRLGSIAQTLRNDALRFAAKDRPDHAHGLRLLAMELAVAGKEKEAIELLLAAMKKGGRFAQRTDLMRHEVGVIAAAWLSRTPGDAKAIQALLVAPGILVPMEAVHYAVLSWESDVARIDLRVGRAKNNSSLPIAGQTIDVGDNGFGPEAFLLSEAPNSGIKLSADFADQAMTGYAFAQLQVIGLSAAGRLTVENRPFVVLEEHELVALGTF